MADKATVDLANLHTGDRVAWLESDGWNANRAVTATVQRLTRTQFVIDSDAGQTYRFKRDDGRMIAGKRWGVYLQDPLDGQIVNARAAKRAREALREIEALGKGKVNDAAGALGLLKGAWREIEVATREIEIMLADMDGRKKS